MTRKRVALAALLALLVVGSPLVKAADTCDGSTTSDTESDAKCCKTTGGTHWANNKCSECTDNKCSTCSAGAYKVS